MGPDRQDDYLERVKAEIRIEADAARVRAPLPRRDPPPRAQQRPEAVDGIDRERLDYAIGELTGPDYVAFVDHAFRAILKRPPDDAGAAMQLRLIAAGAPKAEVLGNLRWSSEGRRIGARVRGLLPRYALAKLARVPLLGYAAQWGMAFAGLPLLLRHQRAADTSVAARFDAAADAQRNAERALAELGAAHAALGAEHDRRSEALGEEIRRLQRRVDDLEQRARSLESRAAALENRSGAHGHELGELRHYVHAANHWVTSLQRSLADLEDSAAGGRERSDAFAATLGEDAAAAAARRERYESWSASLAERLPAGASLLDLGSGDGAWLAALRARGVEASGVEANPHLVERALERGQRVAQGDPLDALTRSADVDALCVATDAFAGGGEPAAADLLREARRALKPGGWLLLRVEREPYRLAEADRAVRCDPARWAALASAAGFASPVLLADGDAAVVVAQRTATDALAAP